MKQNFFLSILISGVYLLSQPAFSKEQESTTPKEEKATQEIPYETVKTLSYVLENIRRHYVTDVDNETLLEYAIQGMLTQLDPHSLYLSTDDYQDLQVNTTGKFGGLGIEITTEESFVKVISPIDDTPAQKAGIQAGDVIIKIDDQTVKNMSLREAVDLLRGQPGSQVKLVIVRQGEQKPIDVAIIREIIRLKSVRTKSLQKDIGYIRISSFQSDTAKQLKKQLRKLQKDSELSGVILDLRNNPGGILQAAVDVSDAFLTKGEIVYTKGREENQKISFNAREGDLIDGKPIVVLINSGTASASEIVAGALQDQKRAMVIGTSSFGKGSVQTILPLPNNEALKLTTALYYTPSGKVIQAKGIQPDIEIPPAKIAFSSKNQATYKEENLKGHLEDKRTTKGSKGEESHTDELEIAEQDYQLFEAINILKALRHKS